MSRNKTVSDHKRDNTLTRNLGTHDGEWRIREAVADRLQSDGGLVIDEPDLTAEESLLDCGAGVGGPRVWPRRRWA